ncbi:MAG: Eco57I restriction-modification methylase domain-containing protein, partial [Christensenellaceae bacterium]|nr:Eco57I restriction-modification methylase domain-containing protein [Christensenellaceae bacterium]
MEFKIIKKEEMEILAMAYCRDDFFYIVNNILFHDYILDIHTVNIENSLIFESVTELGYSTQCEIKIYEVVLTKNAQNSRVKTVQEMFKIMRFLHSQNALIAFVNSDRSNYLISIITSKYILGDDNKIIRYISTPRRYSYSLGENTKSKSVYDFLLKNGNVSTLEELVNRFSVEVLNKNFYDRIAILFSKLVGGKRFGLIYQSQLKIYGISDKNKYAEFAVRLIGRIMFCWFLKEKKSDNNISLIPEELLSIQAINENKSYYHTVLEPLFFEILNTQIVSRKDKFANLEYYRQIPYLSATLFTPHIDDYYTYDHKLQCGIDNIVSIPNEWFINIFEVLAEYNFTIEENTSHDIELSIDPEMLGRIFENLLAEINPETGESAKKATGAFYTPRYIVDYMVESTLLDYLKSKTDISENKLRTVMNYISVDRDNNALTQLEKRDIINSLHSLSVLDPACGSGAFPIGILQKIVYILQELDPSGELWLEKICEDLPVSKAEEFIKRVSTKSPNYVRKLSVIQNSIFAVDIQPIAVEIARIRCLLSLIIEETMLDSEENHGINPLPNLDFKFIVANALVDLNSDTQRSFLDNQAHINALKKVRDEYYNANSACLEQLRCKFRKVQKQMYKEALVKYKGNLSQHQVQLTNWNPFDNQRTDWFDAKFQFGISKFDIVIGNPPYIHLENISDKDIMTIIVDKKRPRYLTYSGHGDLYCLFYEQGLKLLKPQGFLTYITSNKWMRASYGESLRNYFLKYANPIRLIDLGSGRFSSATVDTNIITLQMSANANKTTATIYNSTTLENLSDYIMNKSQIINFEEGEIWTILNPIEQSIKRKIEVVGKPLSEWNIKINYGAKTGCNDAFIIDQVTRDKLIEQDPKSAEIIQPVLRGRDINRNSYKWAGLYLIGLFHIRHYNIDDYPAIKQHLLDFGYEKLKQTGDKGARFKTYYKWFELQTNIAYLDNFKKKKIIYPETTQSAYFVVDNDVFFVDKTCFIMTGE